MGYLDLANRAGMRFAFASMGRENRTESFAQIYASYDYFRIDAVINFLFNNIFFRFYHNSRKETLNLWKAYDFDGKGWAYWADGGTDIPENVRNQLGKTMGEKFKYDSRITFPGNWNLLNIADFMEQISQFRENSSLDLNITSVVHGDLNGNNIIVDENMNVWLIDFAYTERTHILKDISKLEADILFLYTVPENEEEMKEAISIVRTLCSVKDLKAPLHHLEIKSPKLFLAWKTIQTLREIVSKITGSVRRPIAYSIPMLRSALFSLALVEKSNPIVNTHIFQKTVILAAASGKSQIMF